MKVRLPNGSEVEAKKVGIETMKEGWNEYMLEDGTVLKCKAKISNIVRTEQYDPMTGDPVYLVQSSNAMQVNAPDELKRRPTEMKPIKNNI